MEQLASFSVYSCTKSLRISPGVEGIYVAVLSTFCVLIKRCLFIATVYTNSVVYIVIFPTFHSICADIDLLYHKNPNAEQCQGS